MFVVCGEALWDLFGEPRGDGLAFDARIGGSPFNVAVGLARLGLDAALFAGVSEDPLGQRLVAALEREGVATGWVVRRRNATTLSVVTLNSEGEPSYQFYGREAADRAIRDSDLPDFGPEVWGLHAGSFSLAVEPVGSALLALFARERRRRLLALDPNVRLNVEPDRDLWRERVAAFAGHADIVKASSGDLELLYPDLPDDGIAAGWLDAGAGLVVITRAGDGAVAYTPAGRAAAPGRSVDVVDTVGAGDSFQAALIAGLFEAGVRTRADLDGVSMGDLRRIAARAVAASSIACARRGADLPRRSDLLTGMEELVR